MHLLLLGGTAFVGRHLAEAALRRGHALTLFTRGRHGQGLFPQATHLLGDRDGGLGALEAGRWDAVIDTSGYVPRVVRASAALLAGRVGTYAFVSTVAVYADGGPGMAEDAPLLPPPAPDVEAVTHATYGPLKVACEQAVRGIYGERALIVRPGIIAGPHDPSDRFTAWAERMTRGGEVAAPAPADAPVQVIDGRDLADWLLRMLEEGRGGTFNAVGPAAPLTRAGFLEALRPPGGPARVRWVEPAAIARAGLDPKATFPFWTGPNESGLLAIDGRKALAAGLALRPLAETARDTLAWRAGSPARPLDYDLDAAAAALGAGG